jgi:dipeptidyl aminopeptidase/acylaminoacyl peptidase
VAEGAIAGPFGSLDPDRRPDYLDLMAVVDTALARFDCCDPERLGVIGGSYGGFMTAWIVAHTDRFKAGCCERGIYNQLSNLGTRDIADGSTAHWPGRPYEDLAAVLADSPITYVNDIRTPLLLIQREQDLRTTFGQAQEMFTALRTLGREVELVQFPAANHDLSRSGSPQHRVKRFEVILEWFDRHLRPSTSEATRLAAAVEREL